LLYIGLSDPTTIWPLALGGVSLQRRPLAYPGGVE
jgi:hypothetical protein